MAQQLSVLFQTFFPSFVVVLKVRDRLLHAQKHGNHGEEGNRAALTPFLLSLFALTRLLAPARHLRPRPADHGRLQTGERRAGVLRTGGAWIHGSRLLAGSEA